MGLSGSRSDYLARSNSMISTTEGKIDRFTLFIYFVFVCFLYRIVRF